MQSRPGPLATSFSLRTGLPLLGALCLAVLASLHRLGWKLGTPKRQPRPRPYLDAQRAYSLLAQEIDSEYDRCISA